MVARARMQVLSSRRVRALTLAAGAAAVGAGLLLAAGGRWGAAVPSVLAGGMLTWLAGAWVVPGGEDAYCMRVARSVREGVERMAGSYETFERYARRQRGRLERLQPPSALEEQHARLIDCLGRADRSANDLSLPLKARAADTARSLRSAREQRMELIDQRDDAHRRYTEAIAGLAQSSDALVEGAFDRAEEAVEAMVGKLEGMAPPTRLAAGHDALIEGSHRYLEAMRAYHDAVRELDADRVAAGVDECELTKARIKEKVRDLCGGTTSAS